mgnify:FL=1
MARLIRRRSMERLELYDLDKFNSSSSTLTSPRKNPGYRRSSMNPSIERYQFLCNMSRYRTDPIYAATPMFTTIPYSTRDKSQRQLLGVYIPEDNVKILHSSDEKQCIQKLDVKYDDDDGVNNDNENEKNINDEKENADDENQFSSSASENENDDDDGEVLKDEKGIVEQIINRDRKD